MCCCYCMCVSTCGQTDRWDWTERPFKSPGWKPRPLPKNAFVVRWNVTNRLICSLSHHQSQQHYHLTDARAELQIFTLEGWSVSSFSHKSIHKTTWTYQTQIIRGRLETLKVLVHTPPVMTHTQCSLLTIFFHNLTRINLSDTGWLTRNWQKILLKRGRNAQEWWNRSPPAAQINIMMFSAGLWLDD